MPPTSPRCMPDSFPRRRRRGIPASRSAAEGRSPAERRVRQNARRWQRSACRPRSPPVQGTHGLPPGAAWRYSSAEDRHAGHSFLVAIESATVLGEGETRTFDLTRARLATELGHEFENLSETRGPDGMPLGLQASRRIHRHTAAERCRTRLCQARALAEIAKAEELGLQQLGESRGVVDFGDRNIARACAGLFVRGNGRLAADMLVVFVRVACRSAAYDGGADFDGAAAIEALQRFFPDENRRGGAVTDG